MQNIIHADIFFFIASIGFIVFAIIGCVICKYVIGILRDVKEITSRVRHGVDRVSDSAQELVDDIQHDGVIATISKFAHHETKKRRIKK